MKKQINMIEIKGNEKRLYQFLYRPDAPLGEVFDAIKVVEKYVIQEMKLKDEEEKKGTDLNV